jgi:formylglycine-generating enzyme required for sulfatase activity
MAGASDMSGNVWEWTNSWCDAQRVYRSVRGGMWTLNRVGVRCAYRFRLIPVIFNFNGGFRIVSPGS